MKTSISSFDELNLSTSLRKSIDDLGFERPTPIQTASFSVIASGKDVVGIAQTGTGKTFAYMMPLLQMLPFSKQLHPRVLVIVPTRELVIQVVEEIEKLSTYTTVRVQGVYGGTNMNKQKEALANGSDIVVATPGRLYDLILSRALQLKEVKKLVIDEVDVMLDLGFRFQLINVFDLLPKRRQNIMFSATMTTEIESLIQQFFIGTQKIAIAVSGTPLENIEQYCFAVPNFYTKANLLMHLLQDKDTYHKVLVFVANKRSADRLFQILEEQFGEEACVIHSNKTQNYRVRSIKQFDEGKNRILVTTDVMARGLDLDRISHVVNFDTPDFPENYMHRIGRTGRAEAKGTAVLLYTDMESKSKEAIETLMDLKIEELSFPEDVVISNELTPEERPKDTEPNIPTKRSVDTRDGSSLHEKKEKNKQSNQGGSYKQKIKEKYKKSQTRGDKNYNKRNKKK